MSPTMSNILMLFAAFSGMPIYAAMIVLQFLITMIVIMVLVKMKASDNVVAMVAAFAFLGMGYAVVVTPAGVVTLIFEHLLAIGAFMVHKNYALETPIYTEALSLGDNGKRVQIGTRTGIFLGPVDKLPDRAKLLEGTASIAEAMTNNSRGRPQIPADTQYEGDEY